jgi:hypothetical protein
VLVGEFATQDEALAAVRAIIARHGEPWAEWYMLAHAQGDQPWVTLASGTGLIDGALGRSVIAGG